MTLRITCHYLRLAVIFCFFILIFGCSVCKLQKQGYVSPEKFYYKTTFKTFKTCVVFAAIVNNDTCNLLFDTGCQITLIQNDSINRGNMKITGASNKSMNLANITIDSLKIGNITFNKTEAANGNYIGIKEQIPDFGGILGQPIINKANWLINYTNNTIEISSEDLSDTSFKVIPIREKHGSPFTWITIDGRKYKALIDLGSSKGMSIPVNATPADDIIKKYHLQENVREIYRIGGLESVKEHIGSLPLVHIGDLVFSDVETAVLNTNRIRIGNSFFKNCILYIDNTNKCYKVKKTE